MTRFALIAVALSAFATVPAHAQVPPPIPNLENRIPAPLPPPEPPLVANGPLLNDPPVGVPPPARLNTFGDRATHCLNTGSVGGLHGADLDAYTRACVNDN